MQNTLVILVAGVTNETISADRGEFPAWIRDVVGDEWEGAWAEHDLRDDAPPPKDAAGFIITGSSASVTERAPWMLRSEAVIRDLVLRNVPLFGICFGHQLIAQALGGEVRKNHRGREIGTARVRKLHADPLFDGTPSEFLVHATHVDTVAALPPTARVLATTGGDDAAAIAYNDTTRTVQFHPEFDHDIIRRYIRMRADIIRSEGLDPDALHAAVEEEVEGGKMLRNFVRHVVHKHGRKRHPSAPPNS